MFDRYKTQDAAAGGEAPAAYDELPEPELPPIEPREPNASEDTDEQ